MPQEYVIAGTALNMLDIWMPVVSEIRSNTRSTKFCVFVPYVWMLKIPPTDDVLVRLADEEEVECIIVLGNLHLRFERVSSAMRFAKSKRRLRVAQLIKRAYRSTPMSRALVSLALKGLGVIAVQDVSSSNWQTSRTLLFDWGHGGAEGIYGSWFRENHFKRCFAASHAVFPLITDELLQVVGESFATSVSSKTTAIASTTHHVVAEGGPEVFLSPLPRHDAAWINRVVRTSREMHSIPKSSIVLFSRAYGSGWLGKTLTDGRDERAAIIDRLHQAALELDLHLLIKQHPQERNDIDQILGKPKQGAQSWSISAAHPLHLATDCLASFVISTTVVADCLRIGRLPVDVLDLGTTRSTPHGPHPHCLLTRRDGVLAQVSTKSELIDLLRAAASGKEQMRIRTEDFLPQLTADAYLRYLLFAPNAASAVAHVIASSD